MGSLSLNFTGSYKKRVYFIGFLTYCHILFANFCDLLVFDQVSTPFCRKNAGFPGLENFRLTWCKKKCKGYANSWGELDIYPHLNEVLKAILKKANA